MKKHNVLLLSLSVLLTTLAFAYDYKYDSPSVPYTLAQTIVEILITGSLYTGIIYMLLYGLYTIIKKV